MLQTVTNRVCMVYYLSCVVAGSNLHLVHMGVVLDTVSSCFVDFGTQLYQLGECDIKSSAVSHVAFGGSYS